MQVTLYSSAFCGACASARVAIDEAARLVPAARILDLDVVGHESEAESAHITRTPTIVVASDDGTEVFRAEGAPTVPQLLSAMARAL